MKLEQHKIDVAKLNQLEKELIELIYQIDDQEVLEKFKEWQEHRYICNKEYSSIVTNYFSNGD